MISRFRTWLAFKIAPWLGDEWWMDDPGPWCTGVPYLESVGCQDPDCPLHQVESTEKYDTGGVVNVKVNPDGSISKADPDKPASWGDRS